MKILTAAEMGAADRRTADDFGVPLSALMQQAGAAVAHFVRSHFPLAKRPLVLCGKGNNGGDGLVAARMLAAGGVSQLRVLLLFAEDVLNADAARELAALREQHPQVAISTLATENAEQTLRAYLTACDLVLDAVVGTGFKPPLREHAVLLRCLLQEEAFLRLPVVAVDLPSGWEADSEMQDAPEAFRADAVVTFTAPKLAHVLGHLTSATFGPVVVTDIGSPAGAVRSESRLRWTGSSKHVAERPRNINSNKGKFGHILVVAGSDGKSGAAAMASLAALRAGAGLVTAAVPLSIVESVARIAPELMVMPLAEHDGALTVDTLKSGGIERMLKGIKVVALGPGLGTAGEVPDFVRMMVTDCRLPMVLDADALNALAGDTRLLKGAVELGRESNEVRTFVLTPHPGEMARLLGCTVPQVEADRIGIARRFAIEHGVTLVLKGWRTLVAHPDGRVAINTTGNPAMAKGGSGDILTGIVAAMLGQYGDDVASAVEAAVYLHGLAADLCVAAGADEHTVLATDTVAHLSAAFRYRVRDAEGFTWLAGVQPRGEAAAR